MPTVLQSPTCNRPKSKSASPNASAPCGRCDASSAAPSPIAAGAPRVPPPYGTNDDVAAGRRFMLVIDQESFVAGREQLFRNAIEGLLAQLTPADRTMVAALPFGGVMVPFTSDIARIRLAAGRVTGQGSRIETGSDLACRTRRFLESLEGLLRTQATQASPQTLVLFTAGLAGPRRDAPMGILPGMCELARRSVPPCRHGRQRRARERLRHAAGRHRDRHARCRVRRAGGVGDIGSDNPLEGIEHLAGVTGGARLPLDATGTASLLRVARESSALLRRGARTRARRSLRAQPCPGRASRAPRRHRPRAPGNHVHRHGAAPDRRVSS